MPTRQLRRRLRRTIAHPTEQRPLFTAPFARGPSSDGLADEAVVEPDGFVLRCRGERKNSAPSRPNSSVASIGTSDSLALQPLQPPPGGTRPASDGSVLANWDGAGTGIFPLALAGGDVLAARGMAW